MRKTLATLLAIAGLAGCGDNRPGADDDIRHDGGSLDAPRFPEPPALGAQLDRAGRPATETLLIGAFAAPGAGKTALKDAYNQASDPATWNTTQLAPGVTIETELKANLAVWDAFDTGTGFDDEGCGNALRYMLPDGPTSYQSAVDVFADDQLYVDTSRAACTVYFALELEKLGGPSLAHNTCGGRMPSRNAIDMTYSMLAAGLAGLAGPANDFAPRLHGSLIPHSDAKDTMFPFLGPQH